MSYSLWKPMTEREILAYELQRIHEHAQIEDARKRRRIRWELEARDYISRRTAVLFEDQAPLIKIEDPSCADRA